METVKNKSPESSLKPSILFIQESDVARNFYLELFKINKMPVEAVNYLQAKNKIEIIEQYKLIVIDIFFNKSGEEGINLIKEIQSKLNLKNKKSTIIVFSIIADSYIKECQKLGIKQIITISPDIDVFACLVKTWREKFLV